MAATAVLPDAPVQVETAEKFGGFTRFEIELEFVQSLANPHYTSHLATLTAPISSDSLSLAQPPVPLLQHPPFIAYLKYLQYFRNPNYVKYLTYPGPTLKMLELIQTERFRKEVLSPDVVYALMNEWTQATEKWNTGDT